jgi:hypothetical protein
MGMDLKIYLGLLTILKSIALAKNGAKRIVTRVKGLVHRDIEEMLNVKRRSFLIRERTWVCLGDFQTT